LSLIVKTSFPPREFVGIAELGQTGPTRRRIIHDMSLAGSQLVFFEQRSDLSGIMDEIGAELVDLWGCL
jgi:hypothetical protein